MEALKDLFFGELLQQFRQRKRCSQKQLAQLIGVSRETISLWERGYYKPETDTMLHEIARVLDLDEDEKRLLFEARFGAASVLPLHNLPGYNPYFTGREEILASLHKQLTAGKQVALTQTQAISGLGGIGKTQVATAYAYRFREHYHDILWVAADSRETLITSYLTLARRLRLPERERREQHQVIEAVKRWLREHTRWLLILDNIEDLELVREFVPTPRQGAVVLTTRRRETKPVAEPIVLDPMPEAEGILFLLRRAGYLAVDTSLDAARPHHVEVARAIVSTVGGLPLALDQAGAYIAETGCSLSDYLELFKREQKALLQRRGTVPSDHPQSVTMTFSLAFEQVQLKNEAAIELLKLCAYLAPDAIPLEVISEGAGHLGNVLETVAADALQLDQALETLQAYSLLRRDGENRTVSIHRLVQAVLQDKLEEVERRSWAERAVLAVNAAFPHAEEASWSQCERLQLHALLAAQYIETYQVISGEAGRLLHETASYLQGRARYPEAELLYLHAQSVCEQVLGSEHPQVASLLNGLADLYLQQYKYELAEPLYQRAIHILKQALGSEHLLVAEPLDGLGCLHSRQGKYELAEPFYQQALHIREQANHPLVAQPLHNLAFIYYKQGKYELAEPRYQRAIHILEQALGSEHPHVAYPLDGLANLYRKQGKYELAEPLYQRALHIRERGLGSEHPDVAVPLDGLADLYTEQGKYELAEPLYQRALHTLEQALGSEHPHVAYPLDGLANLYRNQGKYELAEPLYQRALHIREQVLGSLHPETAEVIHNIAILQEAQGSRAAAKSSYDCALAVREQALGAHHPNTRETRSRLIALLHAMGQHEEAAQHEMAQSEQGNE